MIQADTIQTTQWASDCLCPDPTMKQWLTQPYRLSNTIEASLGELEVKLCHQHWDDVLASEYKILGQQQAWIREVLLYGGPQLAAFARTVVPSDLYYKLELDQLGEQPLGPKVLFQRPELQRSPFEFSELSANSDYQQRLRQWVSLQNQQQTLYARRSRFSWSNETLILVEVLLPLSQKPVLV